MVRAECHRADDTGIRGRLGEGGGVDRSMKRVCGWLLLFLGARLMSGADVVWAKPAQAFQASSEEEHQVVTFSFTNH